MRELGPADVPGLRAALAAITRAGAPEPDRHIDHCGLHRIAM